MVKLHAFRMPIRQRGLSLVELLVGIAIGLFVVAGATTLFVSYLKNNRTLLQETRVNQDLRAAADLIARDLRRAGYWQQAQLGVWYKDGPVATTPNPYSAVAAPSATDATYVYSKDTDLIVQNNESFEFRLIDGAIETKVGTGYQQLTDPGATVIDAFQVALVSQTPIALASYCPGSACSATAGCPFQTIRNFEIVMRGHARGENAISRTIRQEVRIRNDQIVGACATS